VFDEQRRLPTAAAAGATGEQGSISMSLRPRIACRIVAAASVCLCGSVFAQSRSSDNAVTQAEDAFGFSVGRESLGIYNAGYARGFSPVAAGNLRINGLYFDQAYNLSGTILGATSVKVGLSAQGYPFAAPSGIYDQTLRTPADKLGASFVGNFDTNGTWGAEIDGSVPLTSKLSLGYGLNGTRTGFADGTSNLVHTESLVVRWRPADGIEIMPFWSITNDYDDEAGTFYVPSGKFLPKMARPDHNEGPEWSDFRYTGLNAGLLGSARLSENWVLRIGAFRSVNDIKTSFTNLLANEQPDGSGERLLFADPPLKSWSNSGELRFSHSIPDGPRLHLFHLSVRRRDARREFGGSDFLDLGPGRVGVDVIAPRPSGFDFSEPSHDRVKQTTIGLAYDGRWKNVGEISFGVSKANFRKDTVFPGVPVAIARSQPWLYNGTAAANIANSVVVYAGYARGLEESGTAPPNAANRNQPLPVILTQQKDAGVRVSLSKSVKAVAGLFDLSRPYFGFDSGNVFRQVGTVRSRGAEFSLSGSVTPRLNVVAGAVFIDAKVARDAGVTGVIGEKPVGLSPHQLSFNANWNTPFKGLELDTTVINRAPAASTTDNLVVIPAKWRWDLGGRYHFKHAGRDATWRLQVFNLTGKTGWGIAGSGIYTTLPGRSLQGYLAVDF
jgi:iron complex outermembrane receptor protein